MFKSWRLIEQLTAGAAQLISFSDTEILLEKCIGGDADKKRQVAKLRKHNLISWLRDSWSYSLG